MNVFEKIKLIKKDNNDYVDEFDEELENHEIGDKKYYRFRFINFYRNAIHGQISKEVSLFDEKKDIFMLPSGISVEESLKILSFLCDLIEEKTDIPKNSYRNIEVLNNILDIKELGFTKVKEEIADEEIADLFVVNGRLKLFKDSPYYEKYFDWKRNGVTKKEFLDIYCKNGINLNIDEADERLVESYFVKPLKITKGDVT